jgi:L-asparaginase
MQQLYGQSRGALVLLHGGAGGQDPIHPDGLTKATASLRRIAKAAVAALARGDDALDVVVGALKELELDEIFNAGRGSALQADGQARLTAALMDGERQSFSGVMGANWVVHPSLLAKHLQTQKSRVIGAPGTELLARQLGLPVESCVTPARHRKWHEKSADSGLDPASCDTVGCVVRTADGRLVVGTSTGGRGHEFPGRISDSATVAGTYGSAWVAISATGVGEQIVDDALAVRLETRVRDGEALQPASTRCFEEALARKRGYGWIAADKQGNWAVAHTTPSMSFIVHGETELAAAAK